MNSSLRIYGNSVKKKKKAIILWIQWWLLKIAREWHDPFSQKKQVVHTTNKSWSLCYLIPKPLDYVMSMRRFR